MHSQDSLPRRRTAVPTLATCQHAQRRCDVSGQIPSKSPELQWERQQSAVTRRGSTAHRSRRQSACFTIAACTIFTRNSALRRGDTLRYVLSSEPSAAVITPQDDSGGRHRCYQHHCYNNACSNPNQCSIPSSRAASMTMQVFRGVRRRRVGAVGAEG